MPKSKSYKIGGVVVSTSFAIGATMIGIGVPSSTWFTPDKANWSVVIGISILVIGLIVGGLMCIIGRRYQVEEQQLIRTIPQIINDMHIRRGEFTDDYICTYKDAGAINTMNNELNRYLGGIEIPKTVDSIAEMFSQIVKVFNSLPKTKEKAESVSDIELGRLVAESAKTHLPIQANLDGDKTYIRFEKALKTAREKLPKGMAVDATQAIDHYFTYSKGYWALNVLIANITKQGSGMDTLIQTAYNLYRDKFQEQMNLNLAKVCEVINRYDK